MPEDYRITLRAYLTPRISAAEDSSSCWAGQVLPSGPMTRQPPQPIYWHPPLLPPLLTQPSPAGIHDDKARSLHPPWAKHSRCACGPWRRSRPVIQRARKKSDGIHANQKREDRNAPQNVSLRSGLVSYSMCCCFQGQPAPRPARGWDCRSRAARPADRPRSKRPTRARISPRNSIYTREGRGVHHRRRPENLNARKHVFFSTARQLHKI
jgi:hypothetical protein